MKIPNISYRRKLDPAFPETVNLEVDKLQTMEFPELLKTLGDSRAIHGRLFSKYMNKESFLACGNYRGKQCSPVEKCNIGGDENRPANGSSAYQDVARDMEELGKVISRLDLGQSADKYYRTVILIFWRFQTIHPYFDGNGHIERLILRSLMEKHPSIKSVRNFPIYPHEFTDGLHVCIEQYVNHPDILESYFLRWYKPNVY